MSQLDTTNIQARAIARRNTMPIPQMGITESLNAPGVIPVGPNDRSARIAEQFDRALSATASIVGTLAVENRRQQIEQERADAEAKQIDYGHGTYAARLKAPAVVQDILDGKVQPPPGVAMDDWVQSVVDQNASDMSPAFREAYAKQIGPAMVDAWTKRSEGVNEQARVTVNTSILSGAATDTPIQPYIDEYKKNNPQVNDVQARAAVGFAKAEYAASTRSGDMLESAITEAGLEGIDRLKVASLRARYKNEQSRWESEQSDAAENVYVDRINSGEPSAAIREAVQNDKALTPRSKLNLKRMLDGQIEKDINDAQQASFNTLARDIELGRWMTDPAGSPSVETTLADIERRAFLDPKDPNFISHGQMTFVLDKIAGMTRFDANVEAVNDAFNSIAKGETSKFVATPQNDPAIVSVLASRGIIDATPNGSGAPLVNTVSDPVAFARFSTETGHVAKPIADKIRAQMNAVDPQQSTDGLAAYAAVYLQNPILAREITGDDKALQLKAAYIVSKIEGEGSDVMSEPGRLREMVGRYAKDVVKIDPQMVDYDRDQVLGLVYYKSATEANRTGQRQFLDAVSVNANKDIEHYVGTSLNDKGNFVRPWSRDAKFDNIPSNVTETYLKNLDQQFRVYRSFIADESAAVEMAKRAAVEKTMYDHPPQEWSRNVYFGRRDDMTMPEETIIAELKRELPDGPDFSRLDVDGLGSLPAEERINDLLTNFVPEWNGDGMVFRSKHNINELALVSLPGKGIGPLIVRPPDGTNRAEYRKIIEQATALKERIIEQRKHPENVLFKPYTVVK